MAVSCDSTKAGSTTLNCVYANSKLQLWWCSSSTLVVAVLAVVVVVVVVVVDVEVEVDVD